MASPASNELCGLLAESDRLRAYAAVVLGASTSAEVAERAGLAPKAAVKALQRLIGSGLVSADGSLSADPAVFKEAARRAAPVEPAVVLDADPERDAVLRAFVRDDRLTSLPSGFRKIKIVVEHIAERSFEPGVTYTEPQVNEVLKGWHADHAALRRYLIDTGTMSREDGKYWRSGGKVEV
ncbi:hypothetical protein Afil01_09200 [Actinorhabdospora filicis]|uniref:DUF2087 domain-containing protein n=1 Tax=Actinorhabdospora filicis TaxID=1785913 RepID=A0A9W6SH08_9ACTN|nr:DUF2087 domain-containing protein [Actinorhabdospora filicis]GLZ76113.1 hypothetical protein Afil01_09200 [Actinorhabdospora filicis]